ncbi:MAG: hypothetical protein WC376_03780 [Candidatus Nanoarchaeia archaeon]|jgi:hypothetical protein
MNCAYYLPKESKRNEITSKIILDDLIKLYDVNRKKCREMAEFYLVVSNISEIKEAVTNFKRLYEL